MRVTATVTGATRFAAARDITVSVGAAGDSATEGTDYDEVADQTLTLAAGAASGFVDFMLTPKQDTLDEPDESIAIEGELTGVTFMDTAITLTDDDDAPTLTLALDPASIDESGDDNESTVTATLSGPSSQTVTLTVAAAPVAPAVAADFTLTGTTLTIAAGSLGSTGTVTVTAVDNDVDAEDKTVTVSATAAGGNGVADPASQTLTLNDDDERGVTVTAETLTLDEADDPETSGATENQATYTVVLDSQPTGTVTINLESGDTDVATVAPATLTVDADDWNTAQTVTVTAVDDDTDNPNDRRTATITHTVAAADTDYAAETAAPVTVTVTDDDAAPSGVTLTVDTNGAAAGTPDTVAEGAGATAVTVNATVNGSTRYGEAKTVTVSVDDGTATAPADYAAVADFNIVIPLGAAGHTGTFTITPADDALDEPDETVSVTGALSGVTVTPATVTLTDNDDPPSFSIAAAEADEGDPVVFTVSRAGARANVATVKVATAADTDEDADPAAASDYTAISPAQTLSFGAGVTSQTVSVATAGDDLYEPDETFLAVLSAPELGTGDPGTGVSIAADGGAAKGTIKDGDTQPAFTIANASATEGEAITFTVTRSGARDNAVSVQWNTKADTGAGAAATTDYTASTTPAMLDFAGGVTTVTFTVATTEDFLHEGNETFLVELTDAEGATITTAEATGTITDDDDAPTAITLTVDADTSADNAQDSLAEDGGAKTVRVTATVTSATRFSTNKSITVSVGAAGDSATEGTDYDAVADQTLTLAAGAASGFVDFTLTPKQDTLDEPDESIAIEGELTGVTFMDTAITLTDDEAAPTLTLALDPASIDESGDDNESTVTATLSGASSQTVTLTVAAAPVAPAVAADFTLTGTTLTIAAGATVSTGAVTVTAVDNDVDADDKTVTVSATATGGNGVANPAAVTLTIEDDDTRGVTVSAAVGGVTVDEADDPATTGNREDQATYTVALDSEPTGTVTIAVKSEDTTVATVDPATLTFDEDDWSTAKTVTVTGVADITDNPNDRRTVDIAHTVSASGTDYAAVTASPVTVTVTDDDAAPGGVTLTVDTNGAAAGTPDTVAEGAGATAVTVTATVNGSTRYGEAKTVTVSVSDGTAASPADYAAVANFDIVIPLGAASHTGSFTITPVDDALDEPNETVNVTGALSGVTVTPATVTLTDNDDAPTLTLALDPASIDESGDDNESTVTATLSGASSQTVTLTVAAAPVAPAVAADFTLTGTTLTIAAGATVSTGAVTVTAVDNDVDADDKTVTVSATATGGNGVANPAAVTLTIEDDDTRGVTVSAAVGGVTVAEADDPGTLSTTENEATYTVALDSEPTGTVTIAVRSEDTTVATVDPATLTFDEDDWNTAQTVTVTAVADDADNPGDRRTVDIAHTVSASGTDYASETADPVTVTVTDDDAAPSGVTLTVDTNGAAAGTPDTVAEGAGATAVTVTATVNGSTRYGEAKTVTVSVSDGTATAPADYAAVANFDIVIPLGAASHTGSFTITPVDDALDEPNETVNVTGALSGVTVTPATVTLTDNDDAPTLTLALDPASIDESGDDNESTVTATLSGASSQTVTLTVAAAPVAPAVAADFTLTGTTLTIAAGATVSTGAVTVTAVDNDVDADDKTVTVSATATGGNGVANPAAVTLTIEDDDTRGVTVSAAVGGVTVAEADDPGTLSTTENEATYTVALDSEPTGTVTIAVRSEDTTVATVDPATLTFDEDDWNTAQTVTVTAVADDADNPGDRRTVDIAHTVSASGTDYASETADPVTVTVTDDDAAPTAITLTVDADTGTTNVQDSLAEDGGAKTVRVTATVTGATRFAAARDITVSVGAAGDSATEGTDYDAVADQTLTLAAGAASGFVDFTLTPKQDTLDEPDESIAIEGELTGVTFMDTAITLTDDEAAPTLTLALDPASIDESGDDNESTVTATLSGASSQTVTLTVAAAPVAPAVAADFTLTGTTLTIAAGATVSTGAVTVTAVDNDVDADDKTVTVSATATGGNGVANPAAVTLTIEDDDTRGVTVSAAVGGVTVDEADDPATTGNREDQATYTVALDSEPTGTVTIAVKSEDTTVATVDPATLTFDEDDWSTAKTVTVTGVADITDNPNDRRTVDIAHTVSASGTDYAAVTASPVTVTVTDDDAAPGGVTLTVDTNGAAAGTPDTVAEGAGATAVTVTATVNGSTRYGEAKTVTVSVSDGTAASPADYAAVANFDIVIPLGAASHTGSFTITPVDDALDEPNETVNVTGALSGVTVTPATVTLTDNDDAPTLTLALDPASIDESGDDNESTVTATLSGASSQTVTLTVAAAPVAPAVAADFTLTGTTLTIAAGATVSTGAVTVTAVDNDVDADDKTVTVSATATGGNGVANPAAVTLTIEDDDTRGVTVSAAVGGVTVAEADDPGTLSTTENEATYTVALDSEPTGTVTIAVRSEDTTVATVDPATLTFDEDDWNTAQTVTVTAVADDADNPGDRRTVDIAHTVSASGTDYASETADPVTVTVTDDDAAPSGVTLTVDTNGAAAGTPDTVAEGAGATAVTVTATVNGSTRYGEAKTVTVSVSDGTATAPADYAAVANFDIVIPLGAASHTGSFTITPVDDALDEPNETVNVTGALSGVTVTPATVTLTDNDDAPTLTLALDPASIDESGDDNESTVTATLSGASSQTVTLTVAAAPVAPAVAADFTLTGTTLTIAAGATVSTGAVTVTAVDNDVDADDKTVTVSATATGGNGVANPAAVTLTIEDDDTRGVTVSAAVGGVTVAEADDPGTLSTTENEATYTVALDSEPTGTVTIAVRSEDTTVATVDPATLTFDEDDWNTAQTVTVTAVADDADNPGDRRTVDIAHTVSASGTDYASETADPVTVTVTDDDAAPSGVTLTVDTNGAAAGTPDTVAEGAGATAVTVTATVNGSTRYGEAKTVTVSVSDGTATAPADYAAVANFDIVIPLGAASHTGSFTITPVDDALDEPNETVNVTGALSGVTVTPATVTLTDNDDAPTLTLALDPASIDESGDDNESTVTATLSGASSQTVTLTVAAAPVAPAVAADFTLTGTTLTIAAGATVSTGAVTVTAVDNDVDADDKTVTVSATATGGNGVANPAAVTLTIEDDDTRGVTVSAAVGGVTVDEADDPATTGNREDQATYTVALDSEPTGTVTIAVKSEDTTVATVDPATLTFDEDDWSTAKTVTVTGVADITDNPNDRRTVDIAHTVSASGTDYASETADPVTVTVTDDDAAPTAITLTVDADTGTTNVQDSLAEDGGAKTVRVTATVTGATRFAAARDITVSVGAAGDSATEGTDYDAVADQTLTLAAGAASGFVDFTLTPKQDTLDEPDESIAIEGELTGVTFMDTAITVTDDEAAPTLTLTLTPATIDESGDDNESTVTATLSGASSQAVTLTVAAAPVSPAVAADYTLTGTTLTIAAGATVSTGAVTVTAVDNDVDADDKTVTVSATATGGNGVANPAAVTLTIEDDDTRGVTVSAAVGGVTVAEADDPGTLSTTENEATYTVALDSEPTGTVTIAVRSEDTTVATVDPATLTFDEDDWNTAQTVTVTAVADDADNPGDRRTVDIAHTVSASGTDYASETADPVTVTVTDDDAAPSGVTLTVDTNGAAAGTPDTVAEGAGATAVTVTATVNGSTRYGEAKTVTVSVSDGTATAPADYAAVANFDIVIPLGAASHTGSFTLTPADDALDEPNETVNVTGTLSGVTVTPATVTLTDNDDAPVLSIDSPSAAEGDNTTATLTFTVSLAPASGKTVTVGYADRLTGTATAGTDYTALTAGTLTFAPGETSKTIDVTVAGDTTEEPDETVVLRLSSAANATLDGGGATLDATGTITDDDTAPTVSIGGVPSKINSTAAFTATFTWSEDVTGFATGDVTVTGGAKGAFTAVNGSSYTLAVTPAGSADVVVTVAQDAATDGLNTGPASAQSATATWDAAAVADIYLVAIPTSLPEDSPADVVLTIEAHIRGGTTFDTDTTVTVSFGRAGDSAISGTDYEAVPDLEIVIPAGKSFWAESICPRFIDDTLVEGDEKFSVTGRAGALSVDGTEVTIIDDETREPTSVTLSADTDSVGEGAGATQVRITATVDGDDRFPAGRTLMVSVGATDDTATEGADYAAVADFPVTIAARAVSGSATFTLTPIDDTDHEGAETIGIAGAASDFTVKSSASIEIADNDEPEMSLTLAVDTDTGTDGMQSEVAEGNGGTQVQVIARLTGSDRFQTDRTLTVRVGVDGDSAIEGADYAAIDDFPITVEAGDASGAGTFTLTPVDDTMAEGAEIITVEGRLTGASVDATRLILTDNDEAPNGIVLSASPASVGEDDRQTPVTVTATVPGGTTRPGDTDVTVTVGGGTATSGADFSPVEDFTITIPGGAGSGSGHFALSPIDDSDSEGDETVAVTGAAGDIAVTPTVVTIEDDEAPSRGIVLSASEVAVDEGASASWTVRLSAAPDGPVAVTISGHEGTDIGLDTARLEFDGTNWNSARTVTVTAGEGRRRGRRHRDPRARGFGGRLRLDRREPARRHRRQRHPRHRARARLSGPRRGARQVLHRRAGDRTLRRCGRRDHRARRHLSAARPVGPGVHAFRLEHPADHHRDGGGRRRGRRGEARHEDADAHRLRRRVRRGQRRARYQRSARPHHHLDRRRRGTGRQLPRVPGDAVPSLAGGCRSELGHPFRSRASRA